MEKEFPDVNFVTISTTKNDIAWKKKMKELNAHGVQLREDSKPYFSRVLKIRGYPKFLLYSPEGKLLSLDAPRYSSKSKIRAFLRSYLNK